MATMKTELPAYTHVPNFDPDKGPYHQPGTPVWWTGESAPPAVGKIIVVAMNGLGPAVVKGYFDEGDFLALGVVCLAPPSWYRGQNAHGTVSRIYGAEVATRRLLAAQRRRLAREARETRMPVAAHLLALVERGLSLPLYPMPGTGTDLLGEGEDGLLWTFPAAEKGWDQRTRYEGELPAVAVSPALALGTGWPGVPGLAPDAPLPA